jgi:hypothetical protein
LFLLRPDLTAKGNVEAIGLSRGVRSDRLAVVARQHGIGVLWHGMMHPGAAMGCGLAELPLRMPPEMMASAVYLHDLDSGRGLSLNKPPWQESVSLVHVTRAYLASVNDPSQLPKLEQLLTTLPQLLRDVIPNPKEVLELKRELDQKLIQTRSLLQ